MATANKQKSYQAQARIVNIVTVEVLAKDLAEAMVKAEALEEKDFVDIQGECVDGSFEITGIYASDYDK